jgi:hypothetical protein
MIQSNAFRKFVYSFIENPFTGEVDESFAMSGAIHRMTMSDLISVKKDVLQLLSNPYSDDDLVKIWASCHPEFVYLGEAQRKFMHRVYDALEEALNKANT